MADLSAPTVFAMARAVIEALPRDAKETLHIMVQARRFLSFLDLPAAGYNKLPSLLICMR